jgi:pimeloyl-ACP methyl ester carboxylesterase
VVLALKYLERYPDAAGNCALISAAPSPAPTTTTADPLWELLRADVLGGTARDGIALLLAHLHDEGITTLWLAGEIRRAPQFVEDLIKHGKALERLLQNSLSTPCQEGMGLSVCDGATKS